MAAVLRLLVGKWEQLEYLLHPFPQLGRAPSHSHDLEMIGGGDAGSSIDPGLGKSLTRAGQRAPSVNDCEGVAPGNFDQGPSI